MFRNFYALAIISICLIACKEKPKEQDVDKKEDTSKTEEVISKKEDFLIFENSLIKKDIKDAVYENVSLTKNGVQFDSISTSYVKIPNINFDLNKEFNLSFWFKFKEYDERKPQALFLFNGPYTSPSNAPLFVYLPAKKLSGCYGKQILWAENYEMSKGYSKMYYDTFMLSPDTYYFASINFKGNKMEFFVDSEPYAEYGNLTQNEKTGNEVYLGAFPFNNEFKSQYTGSLKGLKIFSRSLTNKEIIDLYNAEPIE